MSPVFFLLQCCCYYTSENCRIFRGNENNFKPKPPSPPVLSWVSQLLVKSIGCAWIRSWSFNRSSASSSRVPVFVLLRLGTLGAVPSLATLVAITSVNTEMIKRCTELRSIKTCLSIQLENSSHAFAFSVKINSVPWPQNPAVCLGAIWDRTEIKDSRVRVLTKFCVSALCWLRSSNYSSSSQLCMLVK